MTLYAALQGIDKAIWLHWPSVRTKWPTHHMASAPFFSAPGQLCGLYTKLELIGPVAYCWWSSISLGRACLAQSLNTYQKPCCSAIHNLDNMLSLGLIVFITSVATMVQIHFFNSHSSVKEQITSEYKKMTLY